MNVRLFFLAILVCAFGAQASNGQPPLGKRQAVVELISERHVVQAGETFYVAFELDIAPNWHVYWRNAGDSGLPPEIFWAEYVRPTVGDFVWPIPHEQVVLEDEIMNYGFSDRLVLPFSVTVPENMPVGETVRLLGQLEYQICDDVCIIEREDFDVSYSVGATPRINEEHGALIAEWIGKAPLAYEGEAQFVGTNSDTSWTLSLVAPAFAEPAEYIRFFPYGRDIKHAAVQAVTYGPRGASLTLTPGYKPELGDVVDGVVVIRQADGSERGFEVSAPIGEAPLAGTSGNADGTASGAPADGGLGLLPILGFALLGGLVLNLMPCVLPVLSIKAIGLVQAAATGDAGHLRAHGIWYSIGVVVSFLAIAGMFLALRSAGQLVSLGFQLQYPVLVAGLALIMFAIGLWLLGMFELGASVQNIGGGLAARQGKSGAFFTGVLAAVVGAPCVGPFIAGAVGAAMAEPAPVVLFVFFAMGLGMALPFLLLSFAPSLHRFLPKPGAWMERLKQFFAFPMFLTAAWLLSVLGEQAGATAVIWTVVGATLIGMGVWALRHAGGKLKLIATAFGAALLIGGALLPLRASLAGAPASATAVKTYAADYDSESWSVERVSDLLNEGRGVFVDFTATWCATCQVNKLTTLKKTSVQKAFADNNIVFMVADYTTRDDAITAEIRKHNRPGVPMYLYYAPGSRTPKVLPQVLSTGLIMDEIEAGGR